MKRRFLFPVFGSLLLSHSALLSQDFPHQTNIYAPGPGLLQPLANYKIPDAAAGGELVVLKNHSVLAANCCFCCRPGAIRDKQQRLVSAEGYERQKFISAVLRSIHAIADHFPDRFTFAGFIGMKDQTSSPQLDREQNN